MAECVRERPKAKKKKATNIQKNESKVTPKTGGSQPENSIVLQDTEIASTTEKVEIKNKENGSENKANSEPVASLDTSKNVTRIEDKQEIASSEGENENKEINKTETEEGEAGLLNTESVAVQSSLLPATDFHSELPEENDDNLTKNEPESVEASAPFPSLEVTQEDDSLDIQPKEQAVNPSTIISPYAESTAPPPSLEPVELQITGAIATAPPPSIELESENTLVQDDIVMPQSVRPRSQVMTSRESLQQPLVEPIIETMEAFSEYQMKHFYHNQELEQIDFFVDEFLKNSQKEQHEFFELIQFYYKSRRRLGEILDKVEGLQSELKKKKDDAWVIKQNVYKAEGTCSCGVKVSQQQKYQQAFFQEEVKKSMSSELYTIRGIAHETLPLELYNSQVARLRIINYLTKFFHSSPELFNLTEELPISAKLPSNVDNNAIQVLLQLQECISILFHFKRYGVLEVTFSDDLHSWLDLLVAALHRIGTLPDSFFLLNHLLRCPPSTVAKISNYLQFPSFKTYSLVNKWNSPLVHHFMVMLATLTLPVKSRQEFLRKFEATILKKEEEKTVMVGRSISWTLVDEEKEEDEKLEDSWSLMTESDLIAVFDQYPFTELLAYLLDMEQNDEGKFRYSPSRTSSYDVISLFAFSSNLITLLSKIFDTYNLLRYRQFLKCVSRIIRLVTQVVSDHWLSYRNYRIDIIGDSTETIPTSQHPTQSQFNLKRLQMQFDQLFLTAAKHILSSHSAGAIQFLSTMPFEAIQSKSMWAVLFLAVDHKPDLATIIKYAGPENVPSVKELDISPNEGIFLLTALSNMAISRNGIEDRELIEAIANLIIEIAFLNRSLKTLYSKNGKDFLDTICTKHSFVVTSLLKYVDQEIEHMRDVMVYIFELLPLSHWCPTIHDLEKIRTWLLHKAVTSEENQTARILLSNLNYQLTEMEDKLFLPRCYHHLIAIMIVEGYGVSFPDYPGGIQKLGNKDAGFISQVSKYAVSSFTKLMQSKTHAEYLAWGWDVLLKLKLHESEVTGLDLEQNLEDFLKAVSSQNHSNKTGWCITTLNALWNKKSFEFQIEETPSLINVNIALKSNGLFANYVAFSMTKDSHFVDLLLSKGIRYMTTLKDWYQYEALMHMICNIVPLFLSCPERLFVDSFMQILNKLIHVDVDKAGYTDKIWQYFIAGTYSQKLSALVTAQIMQGQKHSVGKAQRYLSFWIFLFLKLPRWSRDCGVLFQIDQLCKTAFSVANGFTIIEDTLYDEYKALIKSNESRGMLSSMMGWLSANQLSPNPTGDFCYYAFASLRVEKRYEEEIGITNEIAKKLVSNSSMTVEEAFKKCKGSIKARYVPPMPSLTIYRWAEQAMVTPKDHPFLSIIWQQFFLLFLRKPTQESGIPSRTGVGMRFFQSPTLSSLLKDMKNSLRATASYHQEKSTSGESGDESNNKTPAKEHQYAKEFHELLSGLFQGFALWLEESRLHDPNLYLDSLPDAYMPDLLMKIFQGNQDIWYEYVSAEVLNSDLTFLASLWQPAQHSISTASLEAFSSNQQSSCEERVVKRLSNEGAPRPSPNVRRPESPVKDVTLRVILTQPKLFQEINHDLNRIVEYAKRSSSLQASHVGLDNEYLEMLPDLYETVTVRLTVHIPCDGSKHKTGCKAPAVVTVKFDELRLRERVQRLLEDNRSAFDQLVQNAREAFPFDLCVSTVNIENIIEKLSQVFQTIDAQRRNDLQQSARKLFYLLAELINDDVKRCYPAIQFFSSGVEVLGKAYIADKGSEQMPLLETTLTHTSSVMFLAPHFSPMCTSNEEFVELYSKVISYIPQNIDTVIFVLLSKFEILNWLNHQTPTKPIISSLLTHTMKAIGLIGREPDSEGFVILEVLRNHLNTLLRSDLDTNYWVVFTELLTLSSQANVSTLCWSDFLSAFDFEEEINSNSTCRISIDRVKESLYYMGCYFQNVCESLNHELEALYKIWEPYTKPLVILLKNLFYHSIIHSFRHRAGRTKETVLRELWENIVSVFKPWIIPQSSGKVWTLLRVESIILLVQTFTDTIRLVVDCSSENNEIYCFILNDLLSFYGAEIARFVIEEQSIEIFHTSLSMLPWQNYCPTVQEMTYTIQIYNTDRNTFKFYASVLLDVDWENVGVTYLNSGNNSLVSQFHQLLLHNILMFTTSSYLANKCKVKLCTMLLAIKNFRWNTLILEDTGRVCQWYSQNMDSALILEKESIVWRTLDFLKQVCGFFYLEGLVTDDIVITKRNIYIQVMTTLITRCSSQKKQVSEFQWVMKQLLSDIESTVGYNSTNPMYELITHCSNCLSLQNHIAQGPIAIAIKSSIDSHLLSTSCAMMVLACISSASRCLANLADMVSLLEQAISCHFVRLNDAELRNAWTPIMQAFIIPELSKEDFVAEAIKQNALLTLYSYNLHRMNNLRTQAEHLDIMVDCVTWCSKPQLDKDSEAKLLLLWLQTFDIVRTQAAQKQLSNEHWKSIAKYMMFLVASTHVQGEDKYYSGVLGMVGIGRRSDLSKEFRLAAKALHLFLTCQLPSSLIPIRNGPDSPGAIRNAQNKNSRPTSEAEKAYTAFQGLVKNKTYQPMRREIEWVIQFVSKPETNINDGCTLLAYLAQQFFFKNNFIGAIIV